MRLFPQTLFGQTLLSVIVGLIVAQSVGFWLMLEDRVRLGDRLRGTYTGQRIAAVITTLDHATPGEREWLIRALSMPPTYLTMHQPWQTSAALESEDARQFLEHVKKELPQSIAMQVLSIKRAEAGMPDDIFARKFPSSASSATIDDERFLHRHGHGPPLTLLVGQAKLSDGAVLTFRHGLPRPRHDWPVQLLGLLIALVVSVALLVGWAVRRLTRPLASLADAAAGLATNLEQAPLSERGPLEISRAARAFNSMQRDLKNYLDTRSHALAAVSHDLRMPITRLRLRIEKLTDSAIKSKMEADLIEMDGMIDNTLAFLRAGSSEEKAVRLDFNALLESVMDDMAAVGARIQFSGHVSEPILIRPQALRRCLLNLLDNAYRYGGEQIDMSVAEQGDVLEIRIEDQGPGIPSTDLERVFEPYVRLESSRAKHTGGSGLGLAIARAIARAHGGDVVLVARQSGGISAILTLPSR
ncbi:MAG TPA: ATP-binding protein [Burkholderiaceae bacterium]|jgi:signal transduction histidine kinase